MAHPLDPLAAEEIRHAVSILRRDQGVGPRWRFGTIELREPVKGEQDAAREAVATCWNRDDGQTYKARVSLAEDRVLAWEHRPGEQANLTADEFHDCDVALRTEPRVIAALERHGIHDLDRVLFDTWAYGGLLVPERHRDRRVGWTDVWYRNADGSNPYANPLSGLHFVVDMNTLELLEVQDESDVDRPRTMGEYVPALVPGQQLRDDIKPLDIVQPEGASFRLDGNRLEWQRWSMRLGFNPREGMVIHTLGYEDGGRVRPVAHRMSFAEMVVPYRDPTNDHKARTAFDIGEWGLGFMTTSLSLGCDCLGEIAYLDAVVHDSLGEPQTIENAICIHEEDDAILWKHVDERPARRRAARAGSWSPSTPPSRTTSTSSTGASTRTATSSARCGRRASWSRRTSARGSSRRTGRWSTSARTRRSTSTSSSRGSTSTSTASATRCR